MTPVHGEDPAGSSVHVSQPDKSRRLIRRQQRQQIVLRLGKLSLRLGASGANGRDLFLHLVVRVLWVGQRGLKVGHSLGDRIALGGRLEHGGTGAIGGLSRRRQACARVRRGRDRCAGHAARDRGRRIDGLI